MGDHIVCLASTYVTGLSLRLRRGYYRGVKGDVIGLYRDLTRIFRGYNMGSHDGCRIGVTWCPEGGTLACTTYISFTDSRFKDMIGKRELVALRVFRTLQHFLYLNKN